MRSIRSVGALLALAVALTGTSYPPTAHAQRARSLRVAVLTDGPAPRFRDAAALIADEARSLLGGGAVEVSFPDAPSEGDFTDATARALLDRALADPAVDVVVALGFQLGVAAAQRASLPKPVILPLAEPALQGLPRAGNQSGRRNLTYLSGAVSLERDIRRFRDVFRFERLHVVVDAQVLRAAQGVEALVREASEATGTSVTLVLAEPTAEAILALLPDDAQAVMLGSFPRLAPEQIPLLAAGLVERGLPSFAVGGVPYVEQGLLATVTVPTAARRRARRVAIYLERILQGEDPGSFPVAYADDERLVINMATARAIGVYPRQEVTMDAELLHEHPSERAMELGLRDVLTRAVESNLALRTSAASVEASAWEVDRSRSPWLPQVGLEGGWLWTDPDIGTPLGQAEQQIDLGGGARQLLWSPRAYGDLGTSKRQQEAREQGFETDRLDTMSEAATAYLTHLRAVTGEHIQRRNLEVARTNLALAEVRVAVGMAGRDEVFRWQIEIAQARTRVIASIARSEQTRVIVNRILDLPLETRFATREETPEQAEEALTDPRIAGFLDDPWASRATRDFFADEAQRNAPELRQAEASLDAVRASLRGSEATLYSPELWAHVGLDGVLFAGGAGSDTSVLPPDIPGRNPFVWNVGVSMSYPIFDGLARRANIRQARAELRQLALARDGAAQGVEERTRLALFQLGAARPSIALARDAAEAATANLELVTDSYRQGAVDIIRLVDAQNQALVAQLDAANAVYDYLDRYVAVQRAIGRLAPGATTADADELYRRLVDYLRRRAAEDGVRGFTASVGAEAPRSPSAAPPATGPSAAPPATAPPAAPPAAPSATPPPRAPSAPAAP